MWQVKKGAVMAPFLMSYYFTVDAVGWNTPTSHCTEMFGMECKM